MNIVNIIHYHSLLFYQILIYEGRGAKIHKFQLIFTYVQLWHLIYLHIFLKKYLDIFLYKSNLDICGGHQHKLRRRGSAGGFSGLPCSVIFFGCFFGTCIYLLDDMGPAGHLGDLSFFVEKCGFY